MAENKDSQDAPAPTFDGDEPVAEAELTVSGKSTTPGLVVRYTTRLGEVQDATVEQGEEGSVRATLLANADGRWQRFVGVPYSADGAINTWDYAPSEE